MYITCLDVEGVLVPEIWIAFAEASGIPELKRTTRDEPDYDKLMKWRLGISIGFLIPLMYVSMHHMLKEWFGIPVPAFIVNTMHGNANAMNFALTQFLLLLPILYVNRKFFSVGFKTLAHRSPNMDSLIALGSYSSVGQSATLIMWRSQNIGAPQSEHGQPDRSGIRRGTGVRHFRHVPDQLWLRLR